MTDQTMIEVIGLHEGAVDEPGFVTVYFTNGVELVGELKDKNGSEMCFVTPLPEQDGIYNCITHLQNGEEIPSVLYLYPFDNNGSASRGIVVSVSESVGNTIMLARNGRVLFCHAPLQEWIPLGVSCGVTNEFVCSYCKASIFTEECARTLDYMFCPYCGSPVKESD